MVAPSRNSNPYTALPDFLSSKFALGGVFHIVSTATEAISEINANGSPLDIDALFRANYPRVARIIARVVRDHSRAEEWAVEAFLRLWRHRDFRAAKVEGWLYRVAVRVGLDEVRAATAGSARKACSVS